MNSPTNKRVLIIGGAGFIGNHLSEACLAKGYKVKVADVQLPVKPKENIKYFKGNYKDPDFLREAIEDVNYVIHLAHDTMLLKLDCNMVDEFQRNIIPSIQLMDACIDEGVEKLLFVSSGGTVYGKSSSHIPLKEDSCTAPISVYGTSKLTIENTGRLYFYQKKLPIIIARPGNAYGPGQIPYKGQGIIATAFASAIDDKDIHVYGDGSVVRDYVHVRDIAQALCCLLKRGKVGHTYNIGTSIGTTLKELLEGSIKPIIQKEGFNLSCIYEPSRGVDVEFNVLCNRKIHSETSFEASIDLYEGLLDTWNWIKAIRS